MAENKASFASVRFQDFELDLQSGELRRAGAATVRLPEQSFVILRVLLEHSGNVVSRAEIQQRLWPDGTVVEFEHSIGAAMNRLRQVLADSAENPRFIETLSRRGYRWMAGAEWVADSRSSHPVATEDDASPLAPCPAALTTPPNVAASFPWRKLAAWLSAGALCIAVATFAYLKWGRPNPVQPLAAVPLTALPGLADFPAISPDGSRVVFEWTGEQQLATFDLYVKTIGSENLLRLTNDPATHLAPTWSPDGKQIAFQRVAKDSGGIYVVPAQGGDVRKLRSTNASFDRSMRISWSPDGKTIAFSDSPFRGGHKRLQLLSLATLKSTPVEHDDKCVEELLPAFSPDGKQLAYACSLVSRGGEFGLSIATADGHAPRIIKESSGSLKGPGWEADGKTLIFTENHTGEDHGVLRELNIENGSIRDRTFNASGYSDDFSLRAGRLAYVVNSAGHHNLWRADLLHPSAPHVKLISTTRDQACPQYSPDGKHIAFNSNRSGPLEIWMSDSDGQNIVQLTDLKGLGSGGPTWSPDSRKIVFDSRAKNPEGQIRADVYVVDIFEKVPRKLITNTPGAFTPNWSRDGQWIYFVGGSDDSGGGRIYRVSPQGGNAEAVTRDRGAWPRVSVDGQTLYFAESSGTSFTLHEASLNPTGTESPVEGLPALIFSTNWEITPDGVYFFPADDRMTLHYFNLSTRKVRSLFKVGGFGAFLGLSVSPDGRYVLYPEVDDYRSDIMLIENFH